MNVNKAAVNREQFIDLKDNHASHTIHTTYA